MMDYTNTKTYATGLSRWKHGQFCDWENGQYVHRLLGPCPDCGTSTFNYGGGWRCRDWNCVRSSCNPAPNVGPIPWWWETDINVKLDGNLWCAFRDNFINLQESLAGFGITPRHAVDDLINSESLTKAEGRQP